MLQRSTLSCWQSKCAVAAIWAVWFGVCAGLSHGQETAYTAAFADGTYVTAGRLSGWHDANITPQLNGKPLFDPSSPVLWLAANDKVPAPPADAFVELVGGDCLPGMVQGYRRGDEAWDRRLHPHLLVKPKLLVDLTGKPPREVVKMRADMVRRIVWQRGSAERYVPGTMIYLDGRTVSFRSLRFTRDGVLVLLAEGTRRASFSELAELHMPERDDWDVCLNVLAELSPDGASRLLRLSTTTGLVATTSLARLRPQAFSHDERSWHQLIQPAWCLEGLWIAHATVAMRQVWSTDRMPLSIIAPRAEQRQAVFSGSWRWQVDRNLRGDALRSGRRQYGWGISMPSRTELTFALPKLAQSFSAHVGLDEAVGQGGCARAQVFINTASGKPLWQSPLLIGAEKTSATGQLQVNQGSSDQNALVLVADAAHDNRPTGADPFDIRDQVDWLEPVVQLDAAGLREEVSRRQPGMVAPFIGWQVTLAPEAAWRVRQLYEDWLPLEAAGFERAMLASPGGFTLRRTLTITADKPYLAIGAFRPHREATPSRIEVRVEGLPYTDFEIPAIEPQQPALPRLVDLSPWLGREIEIEIVHLPTNDQSWVVWRTLELAAGTTVMPWLPLEVVRLQSAAGAELQSLPDGTIQATGALGESDVYTIEGTTALAGITAVRLDLLPDRALPHGGSGRGPDGGVTLSQVELAVIDAANAGGLPVELHEAAATVQLDQHHSAANLIDGKPDTSWTNWPRHTLPQSVAVFPRHELHVPPPARLRLSFTAPERQRSPARFRVLVANAPLPIELEPHAPLAPIKYLGKARVLYEDGEDWLLEMRGSPMERTADCYAGKFAWKLKPDQRLAERLPEVSIPIRENPGPGEARYLRWAWKKQGGTMIVLQIAHDGAWGQVGESKFRYQAGPAPELHNQAVILDQQLPTEWTVITRDLFADFGEFTLTGLALTPQDGECGYFDHILLAPTVADLDAAAPRGSDASERLQ